MMALEMNNRYILSDLGIVCALGTGIDQIYSHMIAGDVSGMKKQSGVLSSGDETYFGAADIVSDNPSSEKARVCALLDGAVEQIKSQIDDLKIKYSPERIGVVIGTSNSTMEEFSLGLCQINMATPAEYTREILGLTGPAWVVSTACSSSGKVFASARRLIESGLCDAVVVGGADAKTRIVLNGFSALEAVSSSLTRPLSPNRDGINLGEGAALFIMRRFNEGEHGIALLGVGESSDAYHLTAPDPEGKGAEASMREALSDASLQPSEIDYINLHGTGTVYNDSMECAAVRRVFGDNVICSSTKPMTGHALGAAGAIEVGLCFISILKQHGAPAHITDTIDAEIAPFTIPEAGNSLPVRVALSNSFAFGGSNVSVIIGMM